eukprot:31617-Eustigmatos_ZCMA.PRE.1
MSVYTNACRNRMSQSPGQLGGAEDESCPTGKFFVFIDYILTLAMSADWSSWLSAEKSRCVTGARWVPTAPRLMYWSLTLYK